MMLAPRRGRAGVLRKTLLCVSLSLVLSGSGAPVEAASRTKVDPGLAAPLAQRGVVHVIVVLRTASRGTTFASLTSAAVRARERLLGRVRPVDGFRATARWDAVAAMPGVATAHGVERLAADPEVTRIGLDIGGRGAGAPELALIGADVAHTQGLTGKGVDVAVLDSGVDEAQPDLRSSIVAEHCFGSSVCPNGVREQDGPGSAADDNGHGTNVAGIITGDGGVAHPLGSRRPAASSP